MNAGSKNRTRRNADLADLRGCKKWERMRIRSDEERIKFKLNIGKVFPATQPRGTILSDQIRAHPPDPRSSAFDSSIGTKPRSSASHSSIPLASPAALLQVGPTPLQLAQDPPEEPAVHPAGDPA